MDNHALTARELHSQKKDKNKGGQNDFALTERKLDPLNRSVDDVSQEDTELGVMGVPRVNMTVPEGDFNPTEEEVFDENYFYEGSPNKQGLQSRKSNIMVEKGRKSVNAQEIESSRHSKILGNEHSELDEIKQFRMQNLTSLVNNPKRDSFLNKLGSAVKNKIDSKRNPQGKQQRQIYKPITEKEVPDNSHIPNVKRKELQRHLQSMKVLANNYMQNREHQEKQRLKHIQREIRASKKGPFELAKQADKSQGGNLAKNTDDIAIPTEFFQEDFQIDRKLLQLQSTEEIKPHLDMYQRYLSTLNADLEIKILKNFDFFNKSFHKFDEMKDDMKIAQDKGRLIRDAHKKLKYYQLSNMIKLYRLQRKRINITRVSDVLRSLTALQQTVPVIDNLITSAQKSQQNSTTKESTQNYQLGLQLIQHANDLINNKLGGIAVTECYRDKLIRLKGQCCKKIEESCVSQVDYFLKQKIMVRNFDTKPENPEMAARFKQKIQEMLTLRAFKNANNNQSTDFSFLVNSIVDNWQFMDFSRIADLKSLQSVSNFPILNDVFLDGNDKLQTSSVSQDYVSSISNTVGVNLDILIRDIKGKHQELLKQGNMQILEQIQALTNELSEEAFKNRVMIAPVASAQMTDGDGGIAAARTCQRPKLVLTFISKCLVHLYQPELITTMPLLKTDMEASLNDKKKYRDRLLQLLLSAFVLQALLFHQMARAFELIEIWILESVKAWQQRQKESQQYLLLHTRDQKQIQRKHELVLGQIVDQFTQQKSHLSNLMSKNFDKSFQIIVSQSLEKAEDQNQLANTDQKGKDNANNQNAPAISQGILKFLIAHFKPQEDQLIKQNNYNDNQLMWHLQLCDERNEDFFKMCKALQNIIGWVQESNQNPLMVARSAEAEDDSATSSKAPKISQTKKIQSINIRVQLQGLTNHLWDVQKQFVTCYKEQVIQKIQLNLDSNEKFTRCKTIDKDDEVEIMGRLLSKDFQIVGSIEHIDKIYPSDTLQIPRSFDESSKNLSKDLMNQEVIKIEDDELVIRPKPQPSGGFKLLGCQLFFNKMLDIFIQTIEHELPGQNQKKTAEFLINTFDIISQFNNNLRGQIIGTGAIQQKKITRITVKHLGYVQNSNQLIANFILPNICRSIFQSEQRQIGTNSRKYMITMLEEVHRDIQQHMADIRAKFIEIIIISVQKNIEEAGKIDYDQKIEKGETITVAQHIQHISDTISQMQKALFSNLSEDPFEIEELILSKALQKIFELLEKLYFEQLRDANSKYAKKRIKVDVKFLLINLQSGQYIQLSELFKHQHFNLLVSMDYDDLKEELDAGQEPVTDISKIQVVDHYSKIKQSIKNILMNRLGIKVDELHQFCQFSDPSSQLARQQTMQASEDQVLEPVEPKIERANTMAPPSSTMQEEEPILIQEQEEEQSRDDAGQHDDMNNESADGHDDGPQHLADEPSTTDQIHEPARDGVDTQQSNTDEVKDEIDRVSRNETTEILEDQIPEQQMPAQQIQEPPQLSTPTKENSPGKSSVMSLGKLDLGRVESQKRADEDEGGRGQDGSNEKQAEPLVSERELEELHQKNQEERKQSKKKVVRNLWSARKSRMDKEEEEAQQAKKDASQEANDSPFETAAETQDEKSSSAQVQEQSDNQQFSSETSNQKAEEEESIDKNDQDIDKEQKESEQVEEAPAQVNPYAQQVSQKNPYQQVQENVATNDTVPPATDTDASKPSTDGLVNPYKK